MINYKYHDIDHDVWPAMAGSPFIMPILTEQSIWTLGFGLFGCSDSSTRGGVLTMGMGLMSGGGQNFAFRGTYISDGSEIEAVLSVLRLNAHSYEATADTGGNAAQIRFTAEAITNTQFEGRVRRPGRRDRRVTMRLLDFAPNQAADDQPGGACFN